MNATTVNNLHDTHAHGHEHEHEDGSKTTVGFWIYLMSDCVIFACLFATFGVLAGATVGGPTGAELFKLPFVFGETALLLLSSFTFGAGMLKMHEGRKEATLGWLLATFVLGAAFIGMEVYEFLDLIWICVFTFVYLREFV